MLKAPPTIDPRIIGMQFSRAMPELFLSHKLFMRHMEKTYRKVDICTYTVRDLELTHCKVGRLLYAVECAPGVSQIKPQQVKQASNIHIKMWIAYKNSNDPDAIWIGSMNASSTGPVDLMWKVPHYMNDLFEDIFNALWAELRITEQFDHEDDEEHNDLLEAVYSPHGQG